MKLTKNLLGGLAVAGFAFAQPVAAQASATRSLQSLPTASADVPVTGARVGAVQGQSEGIKGKHRRGGAGLWLIGLAIGAGLIIWAETDDGPDLPVSAG